MTSFSARRGRQLTAHVAVAILVGALVAACGSGGAAKSDARTKNSKARASTGVTASGIGGLIDAKYPVCADQGQALADYLDSGEPTSNDPAYGDQRQQVLSLSGESRSLYIRQQADAYIQNCDQVQLQSDINAAKQAAADRQAAAEDAAAAAAAAARNAASQAGTPTCSVVNGSLAVADDGTSMSCERIAYIGTDGETYQGASAPMDTSSGQFSGALDVGDASATEQECTTGYYPDLSTGPGYATPGRWIGPIQGCIPS